MRFALLLTVLLAALPAAAHDFWLQPERFRVAAGEPLNVAAMVGHGKESEPWRLSSNRLASFRSLGPAGPQDQRAGIAPATAGAGGGATVTLADEGTHMLLVETRHASSDLPADRFDAYVAEEGLAAIAAHRKASGTAGRTNGREIYSRRGKALVQVGDPLSDLALKPVGHTLEIVPLVHPYGLKPGEALPVRVLFRGRPLEGALIDLAPLGLGTKPVQAERTDADGRAVFRVPMTGQWKLNVIWGWPVEGRKDADYESIFTSLTFGWPAAGRQAVGG
jgi:uncharacterized GH25 family protein